MFIKCVEPSIFCHAGRAQAGDCASGGLGAAERLLLCWSGEQRGPVQEGDSQGEDDGEFARLEGR